ncbi:DsbE family thiol:disulfide interchange protein [Rheinheimera baltica]|uniref:DsbE family thiol:disulfide interchange protein n=1 Tax=Rheinheimera baltica TaxID=67576 RepID=A0ABT9HUV4_9GAMM|nr:DsbE family thiol:disulfide interchange protein [Rheinheimera baltica]MDP5134904.1 DsbE family thiol:disulfide interchange protein [Rheinheimera baltica]MDP5143134.1 DsbE family thiol:disulfide interchange protein [Rheinheimera baltica]MDP5149844.1 DsbE family thiol:disulfide interchange protein [Rheinheimera baltica]MDP5191964.1 DsbE family thiol:disulfide interchange protein [Rheinheimera baltica]
MRKVLYYLPLFAFLALALFLLSGLFSDPRERDSASLNKALPEFALADVMQPDKIWTPSELKGETYLLNVWGTWCPTCNAELGYLTELRQQGVKIVGLYYELPRDPAFDAPFNLAELQKDVQQKLQQQGDPYQFNMLDIDRSLSLDLGVSGAPETFIVDADGIIRAHHIGDINPLVWRSKLAPIYQEWRKP